jgi:hypothetical protein
MSSNSWMNWSSTLNTKPASRGALCARTAYKFSYHHPQQVPSWYRGLDQRSATDIVGTRSTPVNLVVDERPPASIVPLADCRLLRVSGHCRPSAG